MRRVKKYCSAGIPLPLLSFDDVLEVNGEEAFWANLRSAGRARSGHCFTIPQPGGKSTGLSGGGGGGSVLCRAGLLRPTDTHNLFSPTTTACMSSSPTTTGLRNFRDEERAAGEAEGEEEEDDAEVERQRREAAELAKKERLFQLQIGVTRVLKSCAAVTMEELAAALSPTNGTGRGGGGGGELSAVGGSGAVEGDAGRGGGARRGFQMRFAIDMRELKLVVEKLMERSVVRRNVDGSLEYVS